MTEYSVPDFKQQQQPFNRYQPSPADFKQYIPGIITKSEFDVQNNILTPSIKTSLTTAKGYDIEDGELKTGHTPTGFDEINTPDLPSGIYDADNIKFLDLLVAFLDQQIILQQLYGIDVYPTYKMFLNELGTYCSTTKGKKGTLLKNLTIKKQDIRQEITDGQVDKPSVFQKAMGNYKNNMQESGW